MTANNQFYVFGSIFKTNVPRLINDLYDIVYISSGYEYLLAVTFDGKVYGFGNNDSGQLGIEGSGNATNLILIPKLENIIQVSASYKHSLALTSDGQIYAFGSNYDGQLGLGYNVGYVPTLISDFKLLWIIDIRASLRDIVWL